MPAKKSPQKIILASVPKWKLFDKFVNRSILCKGKFTMLKPTRRLKTYPIIRP